MTAAEAEPAEAAAVQLHKSMGLRDVALFFIVAGSNLQWIVTAAAAGPSSLIIWILGGVTMFAPLAIAVVYLSSHHPDEGGLYIWSKRAFGPFAGFITGWTYWASNLPYFPALLYFTAGNAIFLSGGGGGSLASAPWYFIAVALGGLTIATIVNILGLDVGKWLNNIGGITRWTATVALIALGALFWWKFGSATRIDAQTLRPGSHLKDLIFWSVIAFAWTGPEALSFMGGEVKNARRSIPLGLALAAPVIATIYIAGTLSVLAVVQPANVNPTAGFMQSIAQASQRFGWPILTPIVALLVTLSCLGSVGAWLGAVARIPFVAGVDRYLPAAFGRMHPRFGSPVAALLTQSIVAAVFIFLGQGGTSVQGAYDVLVSTTVVITFLPFLFLFGAAIKLYRPSNGAETIPIPGGRFTVVAASILGLCTTLIAMVLGVFPADDEPNKPLAVIKVLGLTALMVGSGIAVYVIGRRRELAPAQKPL